MGYPNHDAFGRGFRLDRLAAEEAPAAGWERRHHRALCGSPLDSPVFRSSICPTCQVHWPCDVALTAVLHEQGRAAAEHFGH